MKKIIVTILAFLSMVSFSLDIRLSLENDCFWHDDSDYTNGARLDVQDGNLVYFIGQNMYTPYPITTVTQPEGGHPYAGYAYAGVGINFNTWSHENLYKHYLELSTGIVGPHSYADRTQKEIHRWLGCRKPMGWKNQLDDEWEIQAAYHVGRENLILGHNEGFNVKVGGEILLLGGTVQDAVGCGFYTKLGYGTNTHRYDGEISVASAGSVDYFYLIAGCDMRYYLWNVFLDGNRDGDSYSVDRISEIIQGKFGFGFDAFGLEAQGLWIVRSKEYETQKHTANYCSFTIGYSF